MKYWLLMMLATVLFCGGCSRVSSIGDGGTTDADTDTDTDTDSDIDTDTDTDCPLGTYNGDFTINTQSDVATLAGYTSISGNLTIQCPSCTNLSELICLTSVGWYLWIDGNAALTNLTGLSALTSVGGYMRISWNDVLANLTGLSSLTSVGEHLKIDYNDTLANLDGLSALTSVGGVLVINVNANLINLDGLGALTSIDNEFWIYENPALPDCVACDLLDQLTTGPTSIDVHDNLDDSCSPVPGNCP